MTPAHAKAARRAALLALILLVPAVAALVPVPDPVAGIRASDVVPRNTQEAESQAPSGTTLLPPTATPATLIPVEGPEGPGRGVALPATPMGNLLGNLAVADSLDAVLGAYRQYRSDIMVAPPSGIDQFEENSTVAYSHDIGDVDRDGVGDLALDVYCTAIQGCPDFTLRIDTQAARSSGGTYCSEPHVLAIVSGRDGRLIREQPLDVPHTVPPVLALGCAIEFVVGTLPLGDGTHGVLVYRVSVVEYFLNRFQVMHDLRLIDPKTGEPLWAKHEEGHSLTSNYGCTVLRADTVILNPLIQDVPRRGISPVPRDGFQPALFVEGVGFNATICRLPADPVGVTTGLFVTTSYEPDTWMARYDTAQPETMPELWRVATFTPEDDEHSVIPRFLFQAPLAGNYPPADPNWEITQVVRRHDHYWAYQGCCYDLTGDGQADIAATTLEWSDTPTYNQDGFYGLRSRVIPFDGASGAKLYEHTVIEDAEAVGIDVTLEAVGDVDADGSSDLAVHAIAFYPTFQRVLSIRKGTDGSELWRITNPRDLDILNVGDADGDGGNDLLVIEWPDWEGYYFTGRVLTTPFANVTHTPVKVFAGATGELVWRDETYSAAVDVALMLANLRANGIIDLDGDGVAEIPLDDPTLLPDRSVIHRLRLVEPSTGKRLFTIVSAGAFALPALAGDADGDGRDDVALFNGDINDLWLTVHDADGGDALWTRRLVSPRLSSTSSALPTLRFHDLDATSHPGDDMVLNFQMSYTTGGSLFFQSYLSQQILGMNGGSGGLVWSAPQMNSTDADVIQGQASPASELFAAALDRQAHLMADSVKRVGGLAVPGIVAFAGAAVLAFLIARRLRL